MFVYFVQKQIIFLTYHAVTVGAVPRKYLETYARSTNVQNTLCLLGCGTEENREYRLIITSPHASRVVGTEESKLWPGIMSMMGTNFTHLFLISLDTPESSNIISIEEATGFLFFCHAVGEGSPSKQNFGYNIH